jgi:hypothetical protein
LMFIAPLMQALVEPPQEMRSGDPH